MGKKNYTWQGTVKIQWPQATNGDPECLIYDKTRMRQCTIPCTESLKEFMSGKEKVYAHAIHRRNGFLEIERIVPDENW